MAISFIKSTAFLYVPLFTTKLGETNNVKSTCFSLHFFSVASNSLTFSLLEDGETYFGKEDLVFKEYVKQIQESLNAGHRTYADATHLNEKSRNKLLDNLNLENVDIYMVVFDTSLKDCLERNSHREGKERVPESALKRMYLSKTNPKGDQKYRYKEVYEVR